MIGGAGRRGRGVGKKGNLAFTLSSQTKPNTTTPNLPSPQYRRLSSASGAAALSWTKTHVSTRGLLAHASSANAGSGSSEQGCNGGGCTAGYLEQKLAPGASSKQTRSSVVAAGAQPEIPRTQFAKDEASAAPEHCVIPRKSVRDPLVENAGKIHTTRSTVTESPAQPRCCVRAPLISRPGRSSWATSGLGDPQSR